MRWLPRLLAAAAISLVCAAPAFAVVPGAILRADSGDFVWPAQGAITTPFALHVHDGIDIGSLRSTAVTAAAPGLVELVGQPVGYEGYGNVVVVRISVSTETIYAHLAAWTVKPGDKVAAGQPLGTAGCTGICTGTHLHFEVRENGTPVNPLQFLG